MKLLRAIGTICIAVAFYVLSVGPVAMMLSLSHAPARIVDFFELMYQPLV